MILIAVDMDAVLCNFHKKYQEHFGEEKHSGKIFSEFVSKGYFKDLEMMPNAHNLLFLLSVIERLHSNVNIEILSSLGRASDLNKCMNDKLSWLNKYNINWKPNFVISKKFKQDFANCKSILIDDNEENCQQFESKDGIAIHYKDDEWDKMEQEIKEKVENLLENEQHPYPKDEEEYKKIIFDRTTKLTKIVDKL